jgi:hypothetical protein
MQAKQRLNGYANGARVRPMPDEERLTDTIPAFRVKDEVSKVIRGIVKADRRNISDVTRALLERGVAAYKRDGKLFEPQDETEANEKPATLSVPTITLDSKGTGKKKRA